MTQSEKSNASPWLTPGGVVVHVPGHGPGCKRLDQMSRRFDGEHRYVCAANCPRKKWLAAEAAAAEQRGTAGEQLELIS